MIDTIALDKLELETGELKRKIGYEFDKIEKNAGNYSATRYVERANDLCYDVENLKDKFRDLSRELEYLENKLNDLDLDRCDLLNQVNRAIC